MSLLTMFSSDYYFYIGNEIKTLWSDNGLYYNPKYNIDRYPFISSGPNVNSSNPFPSDSREIALYGYDLGKHASFVPWVDNKISVFETSPDRIAVSYGFSGCYMAKYSIGKKCYISHIQSGLGDQKHVWNGFCNRNRGNLVIHALFRPTNISDYIYSYRNSQLRRGIMCTIAGVIMPDNRCYAVVVNVETHRPLYITEVTNNYKFFIPNVDWVSEKRDDFDGNIFTRI